MPTFVLHFEKKRKIGSDPDLRQIQYHIIAYNYQAHHFNHVNQYYFAHYKLFPHKSQDPKVTTIHELKQFYYHHDISAFF